MNAGKTAPDLRHGRIKDPGVDFDIDARGLGNGLDCGRYAVRLAVAPLRRRTWPVMPRPANESEIPRFDPIPVRCDFKLLIFPWLRRIALHKQFANIFVPKFVPPPS